MGIPVEQVLAIVICAIGIPANFAVILPLVLSGVCKKGCTKWYILQLAIADMIFLITVAVTIDYARAEKVIFSIGGCRFINTMFYVNYHSSVIFITIMAIDRYCVICHDTSPAVRRMRRRRSVIIITALAWLISFLASIPALIYSDVRLFCRILFPRTSDSTMPRADDPPPQCIIAQHRQGEFAYYMFEFVVMFVLPLIVTSICYGFIINHAVKSRFSAAGQSLDPKRKRAIATCVVLVLVFILCWTPHHAKMLALIRGINSTGRLCYTLASVTTILIYFNSAVNPVVYFIMVRVAQRLRDLRTRFKHCCDGRDDGERRTKTKIRNKKDETVITTQKETS